MSKSLVIRTCKADGTSHSGFEWPKSGQVECSDWNPQPVCGGGLHGLLWGDGNWGLLSNDASALWQVVEVDTESVVVIDKEKVKFQRGMVKFTGDMATAIAMVLNVKENFDRIFAEAKEAASSGDYSTAASSGYSSKAAAKGNDTIAMVAGLGGTVSAGENGCFAACWFDAKAKRNRIKVGYVGLAGIQPDTAYRLTGSGKWVKQ